MKAIGPGDLVRCVDDTNQNVDPGEPRVVTGSIYTVRGLTRSPFFFFDEAAFLLVEIRTPHDCYAGTKKERGFAAQRFVPVNDGEIQIFRDLAANPRQKVTVEDA